MWQVRYTKEAQSEILELDNSLRMQILKGIQKVCENPLPQSEGGYGKSLGNMRGNNLAGYFKIKYNKINIRVVYTLDRTGKVMHIIVVSKRSDGACYYVATKRI